MEQKGKPASIFLSYGRGDDEPFVARLHADLCSAGFDVWFDRVSMPSRQLTFHQEIKDAIRVSDKLVYVAGPHAALSDYVREEWQFAFELDKPVIPILRKGDYDIVPGGLSLLHCEDFRDDSRYNTNLTKLIEDLHRPDPPLGRLFAVPSLPAHFLGRPQLMQRIKDALLIDLQRPVVITGKSSRVGLQGMGGIGKSVLAAALARDRDIRRSYPDGIIWVLIGQDPNLAQLQRDVARHLGSNDYFDTQAQGKGILKQILAEKAIFLILDDVWKARDTLAFDMLGPRCRALVTTRDAGIIHTLQGELHQVDLFTEDQSMQLLAESAGMERQSLSPGALEVVKECGCLPLAIALCGGMAKKRGGNWDAILERLRRAQLEKITDRQTLNEQHQSIWRAIKASFDMLSSDEQHRFAEMAVFPTDRTIPEAAVHTLWSHTGKLKAIDTEDLLIDLAEQSLIRLDRSISKDGKKTTTSISLHDLLHDYATRIAGDLISLHQTLVEAYGTKCPNGWSSGPNDGYFFQEIADHLVASGRTEELVNLLFDFNWIQAKTDNSLVQELIHDYDKALSKLLSGDARQRPIKLLQEGLRLSSHVITKDSNQLAGQLIGRMDNFIEPEITQILKTAKAWRGAPWLRPLRATLHPPETNLMQTLVGHSAAVNAVAITPDGRRAVSASDDHTLKVWDLKSEQELKSFGGHSRAVNAVAVTPDGRHAIFGSWNHTLKVWDLEGEKELQTLVGHSGDINAVAVTPDGRRAVSASDDHTLKVWDLKSGKELKTFAGHSGDINAVSITPDGRRAVSGSNDHTLKLWDLESGQELKTFAGHSGDVNAVAVTPDGRRAVSGSNDHTLKFWDLESGNELKTLVGHSSAVKTVAITPDGRHAVSGSWDDSLKIWDLESGKEWKILERHPGDVNAVAVTPDGRHAVSGSWDDSLIVWEFARGKWVKKFFGHSSAVKTVVITPDGRRAVSGSNNHTLKFWDLESGNELKTFAGHSGDVNAVAITPDGRRAVSGSNDHTLKVWDLESGNELKTLVGHSSAVKTVAITPDGRHAVSGSKDSLKVWNLESGKELKTLMGHSRAVKTVAVTPDGRRAVSGSDDHTLKFWDLESGNELKTLVGHSSAVKTVAITPDGRRAVSGSDDETLKVWDLESGNELKTFAGHSGDINAVVITPDGRRAVSGSNDHTLKVWDLESGNELKTPVGHSRAVKTVAITPDGRHAVSGSDDHTLKLWDLESRNELKTFAGHSGDINAVSITPDGRRAVSASDDHTLKVWDLESGNELKTLVGHSRAVKTVAVTPDGWYAVSGSDDETLKFWDLESGKELKTFAGHSGWVNALSFVVVPDRRHAISGSYDRTLKVLDPVSGQTLVSFICDGPLASFAATSDGRTIVLGEMRGRMHFLRLEEFD